MKNYEKPIVILNEELSEGIYTYSGSTAKRCKSIYILGIPQTPTYNSYEDGYKLGRGCEGCPAWNSSKCVCRLAVSPEEMNWDGDFRPTWEVQGHLPDEKGY